MAVSLKRNSSSSSSSTGTGNTWMSYDHLVKLLLIGDTGVGKTSLLLKFKDDQFNSRHITTIGVDFKAKFLTLGGKRVKLQVWDTAGQERFMTITHQYYRNAHGIVLVYDVKDQESFDHVQRWITEIDTHAGEGTDRLLVGNKADCDPKSRVIDEAQGRELAGRYGMQFMETSAKTGQNVEEAFSSLADTVRLRLQAQPTPGPTTPPAEAQQKPGCCK